jgi:hypothetical protein
MALPLIDAPQSGNPGMPPLGTVIVNASDVSDSVPVRVPLNPAVPFAVAAVAGPDTAPPDCDRVQLIVPDPVESDAEPE